MVYEQRGDIQAANLTNKELIKHVIEALHTTTSRRSSEKFSIQIIKDMLNELETKFYFLKHVEIKEFKYSNENKELVKISPEINNIDPAEIGRFIESIVRVASMNMKNEKAGLYFITELKSKVEEKYLSELKKYGIDLGIIELEQHYLYKQSEREKTLPPKYATKKQEENKEQSKYVSLVKYNWENVGFWKYENNICTIYDKKGNVLEHLPLDKIIKEYVMKMTGFKKLPVEPEQPVEISEKEHEFLKMLYERDMDAETATHLLHITNDELGVIIRKLLVNDVLNYIAHDEIMLTKQGVTLLAEQKKQKKNN